MYRLPLCAVTLGFLSVSSGFTALAQDAAPLAFDAASVRYAPGPPWWSSGVQLAPGRFTSTEMTLMSSIVRAYGMPSWTIKNAPNWVNTERFTIHATFPPSSTAAHVNAMLRALLTQRFRLFVQLETREMDTDAFDRGQIRPETWVRPASGER